MDGTLKAGCLPGMARAFVFTVSGERVAEMTVVGRRATWDGRNERGVPVSGGTYYVLIRDVSGVLERAKVIVLR